MKIINKNLEIPISQIKNWSENPRDIEQVDLERLKKQIKELGIYKPLICIKENNHYEVIGGNMRLTALKELGIDKVWICEIKVKDRAEKIKISLSDNDRVGFYVEDKLFEQIKDMDIKLEDFKVDIEENYLDNIKLKEETIKCYKKTHILLSFEPELLNKIESYLEKIIAIKGIEYEQGSN